jgi:hypothetical protein
MTNDLAEEHSTAMLASERLEAEQADRMKLEKEKAELEVKPYHHLQQHFLWIYQKVRRQKKSLNMGIFSYF